jgi:hypothetical protein
MRIKPVVRPVRARERQHTGKFRIQIWTKRTLLDALLENFTVNPFDTGTSVRNLLDFGDRQVFPFVKKHGRPIFILRDHVQMRLERRTQFLGRCEFAVPDRLERRVELIGGTVDNFPEQFLFARDVRVQTATLHAQGFGKVTHTGGMVAQLREELARSAVNLFFPGDGLGHVDTSLSDAREVWKQMLSLVGLWVLGFGHKTNNKADWNRPTRYSTLCKLAPKECFQSIGLLP